MLFRSWDSAAVGVVNLPSDAPISGRPGGYLGHLEPGATTTVMGLAAWSLDPDAVVGRAVAVLAALARRVAAAV